jgi:hypothetical protein
MDEWISRCVASGLSVGQLRDAVRKACRVRTPKGQVLRTRGSLVIVDRKFPATATPEAREKAVAELSKLLEELEG